MDRNEREKKMLYEWGIQNHSEDLFPTIDKEKESYFIKRKNNKDPYIREYDFETLPELASGLDILWENDKVMEQIKKMIGIAALKNKPSKVRSEEIKEDNRKEINSKQEAEDKLPVFIYNF